MQAFGKPPTSMDEFEIQGETRRTVSLVSDGEKTQQKDCWEKDVLEKYISVERKTQGTFMQSRLVLFVLFVCCLCLLLLVVFRRC